MANIYRKIYKEIKKHKTIVITRHIGADPDALGSQFALKELILNKFPNKKFIIIGNKNAITYKEFFPFIKENKVG